MELEKNNNTDISKNRDAVLLTDIKILIHQTKNVIVMTANSALVMLYWNIGKRIQNEILKNDRAEYGANIIIQLAKELSSEYGKGFTKFSLSRMISFYNVFSDESIVATLSQQLGWSHFVELIPLTPITKLEFYSELCRIERWSVRTLRMTLSSFLSP